MTNINFDEVRRLMDAQKSTNVMPTPAESSDISDADVAPVGSDWMNNAREQKSKYNEYAETPKYIEPESSTQEEETLNTVEDFYNGPGLVIENTDPTEGELNPGYTGVTPETQSLVDAYLSEMDETIDILREEHDRIVEETKENQDEEDDIIKRSTNDDDRKKEFNDKYEEAVVIIDKTGFGHTINFTDDEREKLEIVKKIKLEEIETVEIESIKTKKVKKKSELRNIIKRHIAKGIVTPVVLPVSGYIANMSGCSAYELANLLDDDADRVRNAQKKWSLIHSKIQSTSIGDMDFNEFMHNTATADYNTLIYGILCSTYPDDDSINLKCEHCKTEFNHRYSTRSLIRAELMSDKLKDAIADAADASINEADAKEVHEASLVNIVKKIKLPASNIIVEVYVQSAYDFVNKFIKDLKDLNDDKYGAAAMMSTLVRTMYIPDDEEPGTYFEIDTTMEIIEVIYNLSDIDIRVITKFTEDMLEDMEVQFGFMNITCPKCGHFTPTHTFDIESLLFHKYRQALEAMSE